LFRTSYLKCLLLVIFILIITENKIYATDTKDSKLHSIYHIYINEKHIGDVRDINEFNKWINNKKAEYKELHPNKKVNLIEDISYVEELLFHDHYKNPLDFKILENNLSIGINASLISINDEISIYVEDKDTANKLIKEYKLQFLNQEDLSNYTGSTDNGVNNNSNRIIKNIRLKEKIEMKTTVVNPKEILSMDKALTYLNTGKDLFLKNEK